MQPVLCKGEARKGMHLTLSRPLPVPAVRLDTWLLWAPSILTYLYSSSAYLLVSSLENEFPQQQEQHLIVFAFPWCSTVLSRWEAFS